MENLKDKFGQATDEFTFFEMMRERDFWKEIARLQKEYIEKLEGMIKEILK